MTRDQAKNAGMAEQFEAGFQDYFDQNLDAARLKTDAAYCAGADDAGDDYAVYQEDLALDDLE
mgnify:CR=1 FL=1